MVDFAKHNDLRFKQRKKRNCTSGVILHQLSDFPERFTHAILKNNLCSASRETNIITPISAPAGYRIAPHQNKVFKRWLKTAEYMISV